MKPLALIAILTLPLAAAAQTDSTQAPSHPHSLELSASNRGVHASVKRTDSLGYDQPDTIRIMLRHKEIKIISLPKLATVLSADSTSEDREEARRERRNAFTYWSGIDIGVNTFITSDGRIGDGPKAGPMLLNNLRSRWVSINFLEHKYEFGDHRAGLFWGLGLEFTGYHLSDNVRLGYDGDSTYATPVTDVQFTKNKIRQTGLRVPLMFEFNTKRAPLPTTQQEWAQYHADRGFTRKGNFHIAVGAVGSWYFDNMYKQKYTEGGENKKVRDNGDYNLLPYRVAASVRLGYGALNLFAEYGLTPLFKEGTAPSLTPLTVGITLIGFN